MSEKWTDEPTDSVESEYSKDELDTLKGEEVPDREAMSLVDANVAVPVNAAVSANVLSDHSTATSTANQNDPIHQSNT